jgi:hypothetical protein
VERSNHEEEAEISAVATAFIRNNQVTEDQYSQLLQFIKYNNKNLDMCSFIE